MKFSVKDFFGKFNQIQKKMWILSYSLKTLTENFIFVCSGPNNFFIYINIYIYIYIYIYTHTHTQYDTIN